MRADAGKFFGGDVVTVKCAHCSGTGKCNCFDCSAIYDHDGYGEQIKKYPNSKWNCRKCNGFGFVLLKNDGTIIIPDEV